MEHALETPATHKRSWSDAGLALSVVLAVPLAMIVEGLAVLMIEHSATGREFAVLSLFAAPLITVWAAIAMSVSRRALAIRIAVAALLLLAPPALLFGVFNV